jgi:hypothetical protein
MMLEDAEKEDRLILSGEESPLVWVNHQGVSTTTTFFLPDRDSVSRMEFLFSNATLTVSLWLGERRIGFGSLFFEANRYVIRLIGKPADESKVKRAIWLSNVYLMTLHTHHHQAIPLKSAFLPDTLNVIVGMDRQFDTNYDVFWFDQSLYVQLEQLASVACTDLFEKQQPANQLSFDKAGNMTHRVERLQGFKKGIRGEITHRFTVKEDNLPMRQGQEYLANAAYTFYCHDKERQQFMLNKIVLTNLASKDFIELHFFDFNPLGMHLLYVDLIQNVIMEDRGAWNIQHVLHILQQQLREVPLSN